MRLSMTLLARSSIFAELGSNVIFITGKLYKAQYWGMPIYCDICSWNWLQICHVLDADLYVYLKDKVRHNRGVNIALLW